MGGREELGSKAPPASQHSELVEGEEASPPPNPRRRSEELGTVLAERDGS